MDREKDIQRGRGIVVVEREKLHSSRRHAASPYKALTICVYCENFVSL